MARKPIRAGSKVRLRKMNRPLFQRTLVSVMALLFGCGWLGGCGGPAIQPQPAQLAAQLQTREQKNPLQEQLMAQASRAALAGYRDYAVGPEDLLAVAFLNAEDMNREVRVNGQGEISLPLVGSIKVSGLSPQDIEKRLAQLYREEEYIKSPQITVQVKEYRHQRVMVTGAVKNPGALEMIGPRTLLEMLGAAGGITDKAGDMVQVVRAQSASGVRKSVQGEAMRPFSPGTETIIIDLKRLLSQGTSQLNLPIKNGDVVYVPYARFAYVLGAVLKPTNVPVKDNITATQAVAMAGGQHPILASNRVTITRLNDKGKIMTLSLDLGKVTAGKEGDIPLKENDIVYVQESGLRRFLYDFRNLMPGSYGISAATF
jgi:polysaccharide biosynthesis/export protein